MKAIKNILRVVFLVSLIGAIAAKFSSPEDKQKVKSKLEELTCEFDALKTQLEEIIKSKESKKDFEKIKKDILALDKEFNKAKDSSDNERNELIKDLKTSVTRLAGELKQLKS